MSSVLVPTGPDTGAVWHHGDPLGEQRTAAHDVVVVDRSRRAVLALSGKDRLSWLHTISSQHVSDLTDGVVVENLSLDGQGRVEDHWLQTDIDGVTYLDTESWRGEPLLAFLRKMVFWADVVVEPADLAVLSLVGPRAVAVCEAVGVVAPPRPGTAAALNKMALTKTALTKGPATGGFVRTLAPSEIDLVVPRDAAADVTAGLVAAGARPAGTWAYDAHRVVALRPRLGVDTDDRTIPHEVGWIGGPGEGAVHLDKGCYRGQETVARVHNLGKPPRMLVLLHLDGSGERPATGDPVLAGGRAVGRLGTVVDHVDLGPVALALVKRGLPADTPLVTGGDVTVSAAIDADSLPVGEHVGAGRLAVERLRGGPR